jgi:hypothetical protein
MQLPNIQFAPPSSYFISLGLSVSPDATLGQWSASRSCCFIPPGKDPPHLLVRRLRRTQARSGPHGEVEILNPTGDRNQVPRSPSPSQSLYNVKYAVSTAMTMKTAVCWDIKTHFLPHRRHITPPLQSPAC